MVVIEHNLEVVKAADWIVDLGPEGGDRGGQVVVAGTPETVVECGRSHTGHHLRAVLDVAREADGATGRAVAGARFGELPDVPLVEQACPGRLSAGGGDAVVDVLRAGASLRDALSACMP